MTDGPATSQGLSDYHVHSTWSDDAESPLEDNLAAAQRRGLATICMVEHVRTNSAWVADFVAAANGLRPRPGIDVLIGLEAKLLNPEGTLDIPPDATGLDHILVADHQWPTADGPRTPTQIRALVADGTRGKTELIADLVDATAAAVQRYQHCIVAHLWSILPKVGFHEDDVPDAALAHLARAAARGRAWVEVNEKWSCPGVRTLRHLVAAGVPLVLSTDAHHCRDVGVYRRSADQLALAHAVAAQPMP